MNVSNLRTRWPSLAAVAVLLLTPVVLLWPCLVGGRTFVPYDLAQFPPASASLSEAQLAEVREGNNYDVTEVPIWFMPELRLARQALDEGQFPHWNSYARGGTVLQGHGHIGLLYPPNWIAISQPDPADGLVWLAYLNFALAGLLTFGLLRETGLAVLAALFGGIAFAYSGTLLANAHFFMRAATLVWLPGLLWAALRIAHAQGQARIPGMICLAIAMSMTWLAGFPPYAVAVTLLAAGWCTFLVAREWRRENVGTAAVLGVQLLSAAVLGILLSAAQLLPELQFFPQSHRNLDPALGQLSQSAFDVFGGLGYLFPDLFGHPSITSELPYEKSPFVLHLFRLHDWDDGKLILPHYNFTEYAVFPGTLTVFLALVGAIARRRRFNFFALGTLVVLGLLATFSWPMLYAFRLPAVQTVPPLRFMAPAALFVAWLAAIGMDRALTGLSLPLRRSLWIGGAVLALLCLCGAWLCGEREVRIHERLGVAAQAAERYRHINPDLITESFVRDEFMRGPATTAAPEGIDYFEVGRRQAEKNLYRGAAAFALGALWIFLLPWMPRRRLFRLGLPLVAIAATGLELVAVGRTLDGGLELRHPHETEVHDFLRAERVRYQESGGFMVARAATVSGLPIALPPGTLGPMGIRDLNVYTFLDGHSHEPLQQLYGPELIRNGYLVQSLPDDERLQHPLLDLYGIRFLLSNEPLQHAGQRVGPELRGPGGEFFVYERSNALPRAFTVPRLRVLDDDAAVLEELARPSLQPRDAALVSADQMALLGPPPAGDAAGREVRFLVQRPADLAIEVERGDPCYLVLADTWLPGWSAYIDEVATPMVRCNGWMRAIELPDRRCRVRFRYYTPGLSSGLVLAMAGILALMGLSLSFTFSRRPQRKTDGAA